MATSAMMNESAKDAYLASLQFLKSWAADSEFIVVIINSIGLKMLNIN